MLQSAWNHQAPYRVNADALSALRAGTGTLTPAALRPFAGAWTGAMRQSTRARPTLPSTVPLNLSAPPFPLVLPTPQIKVDLGLLIAQVFRPMQHAVLATVCLVRALRELAPQLTSKMPRTAQTLPQMLLVRCLAEITGGDAPRAVAALAALRQLDPQRAIAHAWQLRGQPCAEPSPDSVVAWRLVSELAATPAGMEVLQAVLEVPIAPAHRPAFCALLQATRLLAREGTQQITPVSLLRDLKPTDSAAGRTLLAAAARMAGESRFRSNSMRRAGAQSGTVRPTQRPTTRLRSTALSLPFDKASVANWTFVSASGLAAGIASAMSVARVRHLTRPVSLNMALPSLMTPSTGPATLS